MSQPLTTEQPRPNLFNYATSELSQDAFICWLAAWADPMYKDTDPALHETACDFVVSMIHKVKPDYTNDRVKTVNVRQQINKLDVLIEINKHLPDDKLAILVEDKTHTSNHSDQLNRYYDQFSKEYQPAEMIPLYLKTGYQSRFDTLGLFKTYLRKDFLNVLRPGRGRGVQNAIFNDFLSHLEQMDAAIRQFSGKVLEDWNYLDWQGFFMVLYDNHHKLVGIEVDNGANWGYVANPSGGFFGYWWYFKTVSDILYMPYLQLEEKCLVFKIEVKDEAADRRVVRDDAHQRIMNAASQLNFGVDRPERMGNGRFMTVARWTGEYRVFTDGKLDFEATLANLKKAQRILDTAFLP
ncbi:MAG: PD-(D/E)XK nuclease family protein [Bacteroidetes bacterium]|nr:PD-(D/E)XK nuclease family protein [Fibrella sp.]